MGGNRTQLIYVLVMGNVIRLGLCVTAISTLFGCSPPWIVQIDNDFSTTSHLSTSGPGKCPAGSGDLAKGTTLLLNCKIELMTIKFTDPKGRECVALGEEIARKSEELDIDPIFHKRFFKIRLSRLNCHPESAGEK